MAHWTAADIPDLTGRTAVVTGANSGLGFHTALELARHGASVTMACRDPGRGDAALAKVRAEVPAGDVTLARLDLADLSSVRAFGATFEGALDILVNNAGVMAIPRQETADGFEMQFGTNHLGHFALTGLLMPRLLAAGAPRVVTVSSMVALIGSFHFDDLQRSRRYGRWMAYGQSKLSNQLFAYELDRRARSAGLALTSAAAHPGYAATNLQSTGVALDSALLRVGDLMAQSDRMGALPSLYAATAPGVKGGEYYGPALMMRGYPRRVAPAPGARSKEDARRLWDASEDLTGVHFELTPA